MRVLFIGFQCIGVITLVQGNDGFGYDWGPVRYAGFDYDIISQKVFLKSFCRSQLPDISVNLSFTITNMKNKLTNLCGN